MVKPDGVQRGLVGQLIHRFEQRGFKLVALKLMQPSLDMLHTHYSEHSHKAFFSEVIDYMSSGPVVPMIWEGNNIIALSRAMLGATNPLNAQSGTIRGDLAVEKGRNICHASDSQEAALREINHWFDEKELILWASSQDSWVHEQ